MSGSSHIYLLSSSRTLSQPATRSSRVLIVADNSFARHAVGEIFKREPDFQVCGAAGNGHEAIRLAQILGPDVIVLDLAMPVMNSLEAGRMLRRLMPEILLVMYSDMGDKYVEQQAKLIGIAALIAKTGPPGHFGKLRARNPSPPDSGLFSALGNPSYHRLWRNS